jgi:hypothetical protein
MDPRFPGAPSFDGDADIDPGSVEDEASTREAVAERGVAERGGADPLEPYARYIPGAEAVTFAPQLDLGETDEADEEEEWAERERRLARARRPPAAVVPTSGCTFTAIFGLAVLLLLFSCTVFDPIHLFPGAGRAVGQPRVVEATGTATEPPAPTDPPTVQPSPSPQKQGGGGGHTGGGSPTPTPARGGGNNPTPTPAPNATATSTPRRQPTATATTRPQPTATSTPRPQPTATSTPSGPLTATVRFTAISRGKTADPHLKGCPSGCDFRDNAINHTSSGTSTFFYSSAAQDELAGWVRITNTSSGAFTCGNSTCNVVIQRSGGPGWATCSSIYRIRLGGGQSTTVWCQIYVSSPHSEPIGWLSGACYGCGDNRSVDIVWRNTTSLQWYARIGSADCGTAINWAKSTAHATAAGYWASHTSGDRIVWGPRYSGYFTTWCSPGVNSYVQSFRAGASQTVSGLAWDPNAARSAARARLNRLLDPGWHWVSQTTCAPIFVRYSDSTVYVDCGESGMEAITWTGAMKASLASSLAGKSVGSAASICDANPNVVPGSCSVSVSHGSTLPSDPAKISINARDPAGAANPAASRLDAPPGAAALGGALAIPALALALLYVARQFSRRFPR